MLLGKRLAAGLMAAMIFSQCSAGSAAPNDLEKLEKADMAHKESLFEEAHRYLKQAEQKSPSNFEVIWRLARSYYFLSEEQSGKEKEEKKLLDQGLEYAEKALEMNEARVESLKWYAILRGRKADLSNILAKAKAARPVKDRGDKAFSLAPDDPEINHLLGRWEYTVRETLKTLGGSYERAVKYFETASRIEPDAVRHRVWLGKALLKLNLKKDATESFRLALELKPKTKYEKALQKDAENLLKK